MYELIESKGFSMKDIHMHELIESKDTSKSVLFPGHNHLL